MAAAVGCSSRSNHTISSSIFAAIATWGTLWPRAGFLLGRKSRSATPIRESSFGCLFRRKGNLRRAAPADLRRAGRQHAGHREPSPPRRVSSSQWAGMPKRATAAHHQRCGPRGTRAVSGGVPFLLVCSGTSQGIPDRRAGRWLAASARRTSAPRRHRRQRAARALVAALSGIRESERHFRRARSCSAAVNTASLGRGASRRRFAGSPPIRRPAILTISHPCDTM